MALARVQYTQQISGNRNFTVTFPYISRDHVHVSVDGDDVPFSWLNPTTVQLNTAPALGSIIDVRRETERHRLLVDYQDASTITEQQLDLAARQSFYIAQEAFDATGATLAVANDGSYSANNRRISNLGDPDSDDDAANVRWVKAQYQSGKDAHQERLAAELARIRAEEWAQKAVNNPVESGKYSSYHHATKAAESASAASTSAANALSYRNTAATHASTAGSHAADAATQVNLAKDEVTKAKAEVTKATNEANRSKNEADRSYNEAERAKGYASGIGLPPANGKGGQILRQKPDESGLEYIKMGKGGALDASTLAGVPVFDAQGVVNYRNTFIPIVSDGQVMEIGQYIDFHNEGSTTDFDVRLRTRDTRNDLFIVPGTTPSHPGYKVFHEGNLKPVENVGIDALHWNGQFDGLYYREEGNPGHWRVVWTNYNLNPARKGDLVDYYDPGGVYAIQLNNGAGERHMPWGYVLTGISVTDNTGDHFGHIFGRRLYIP